MKGAGVSRLDVVLANPVAAAAITRFDLRWDLVEEKHVPIQVTIGTGKLGALEAVQDTRPFKAFDNMPDKDDQTWDKAYDTVNDKYGTQFRRAVADGDIDSAHHLCRQMAEACIHVAAGKND